MIAMVAGILAHSAFKLLEVSFSLVKFDFDRGALSESLTGNCVGAKEVISGAGIKILYICEYKIQALNRRFRMVLGQQATVLARL